MDSQTVFVTDNLKLAMAMTAAGFRLRYADNVENHLKNYFGIVCELDDEHNGVSANYLQLAFNNGVDAEDSEQFANMDDSQRASFLKDQNVNLVERVNEIIAARGITPEEYVVIAFDAARAALHNRSTVIYAVRRNQKLVAKDIGNGRSIIYRKGTSRDDIKKLIDNA